MSLYFGINLILWILKPTILLHKINNALYKFDPMDFETYNSVADFEADIV